MNNRSKVRWIITGFALLTAFLVYYVSQFDATPSLNENETLMNSALINSNRQQDKGVAHQNYVINPRGANSEKITNLFIVDRPPVTKVKPEKPVAPPLPYVFMGKITDVTGLAIFLTRNEKVYVVRSAGQIDPEYRVDLINPPLMEFTYLPLKEKQVLNIGVKK